MYSLFYAVEPSAPDFTSPERDGIFMYKGTCVCTYVRSAFAPKSAAKILFFFDINKFLHKNHKKICTFHTNLVFLIITKSHEQKKSLFLGIVYVGKKQ
jgi:hypothetical protein